MVLKDGRVKESGTYDELLSNKSVFFDMVTTLNSTSLDSSSASNSSKSTPPPTPLKLNTSNGNLTKERDNIIAAIPSTPAVATNTQSTSSTESTKKLPQQQQQMSEEDREVGDVAWQVYLKWSQAAGGLLVGVCIVLLFFAGEFVAVLASWWLSFWSEHWDKASPWLFLAVYILFNAGVSVTYFLKEYYVKMKSLNASNVLFYDLMQSVLHAPMAFFDTTPLGRVTNRFSKDIYTIDEQIPQTLRSYLTCIARVISICLYITLITPSFLLCLLPIALLYHFAQRYYIKTSRELTRIESTSRSPIYAMFAETLDGLPTLRAFHCERRLTEKCYALLDANQRAYYHNFSANCWLAVRLELAGTLIIALAALFAVLARDNNAFSNHTVSGKSNETYAGMAGLAISLSLNVTQSLNWSVRMASDMESQMVSVERVKNYSSMPQEAAHHLPGDPTHSKSDKNGSNLDGEEDENNKDEDVNNDSDENSGEKWPERGEIVFENVSMRYREGLPLVLKGLSLKIGACEKIGIVGRTGAGKSSLLTALLRLVELDGGSIFIDGRDIASVGLHCLRSSMAVIPQDPVLFSGTIRSNLDPFHEYSDLEIWDGLKRTLLSVCVLSLDDVVTENGANFSVGQRQLLCIARALLSRARIIVMDEATAAVDVETDAAIQKTVRTEFANATCLTVAHRLNTILDSDRVLVMSDGIAAEFDTPQNLLTDETSVFYSLVNSNNDNEGHSSGISEKRNYDGQS